MKAGRIIVALLAGLIFGFGLALSGMMDPTRVQGFLDLGSIPDGRWDPSLGFVLGGAVVVAFLGVRLMGRLQHPVLDQSFHVPTNTKIDRPLVLGSILFGLGWGLGGFCPGPAVASLSLGLWPSVVFVIAMISGMLLHDTFIAKRAA
ncbi:hypothetical protein FHS85_000748 [Rhodoligotrophos appendicifer]|uniref:DUF6691 family protein n=1 Tax=Rhodoligotrophos appendicifer TaxID=987056 RepID=UPI001180614F|nr:DUF6691 family protein [Rhodoligotrophos appendicifer]